MEYRVINFEGLTPKELEAVLNRLSQEDWRVSCYAGESLLVLERHRFVAPKPILYNWAMAQPASANIG